MKFEYLKSYNWNISRKKKAFEVKWKTFFLVSKVLSFRHFFQTSKSVADTTFKCYYFLTSYKKSQKNWRTVTEESSKLTESRIDRQRMISEDLLSTGVQKHTRDRRHPRNKRICRIFQSNLKRATKTFYKLLKELKKVTIHSSVLQRQAAKTIDNILDLVGQCEIRIKLVGIITEKY